MLDDGDDDASFAALGPLVAEGQSATMIAAAGPSTSAQVVAQEVAHAPTPVETVTALAPAADAVNSTAPPALASATQDDPSLLALLASVDAMAPGGSGRTPDADVVLDAAPDADADMDAATPLYGLSDPIDGGVLRQAQTDLAAVPDGRQADSALDLIMSAPYDERYNRRLAQFFSLPQKQSRSKESIAMWDYYCEQTLRRQWEVSRRRAAVATDQSLQYVLFADRGQAVEDIMIGPSDVGRRRSSGFARTTGADGYFQEIVCRLDLAGHVAGNGPGTRAFNRSATDIPAFHERWQMFVPVDAGADALDRTAMIRALRKRRLTLGDAHALFQECETILRADYVALGKNLDAYRPFVGESENDRFPCCTAAGLILDMERRQRPVAVNAGILFAKKQAAVESINQGQLAELFFEMTATRRAGALALLGQSGAFRLKQRINVEHGGGDAAFTLRDPPTGRPVVVDPDPMTHSCAVSAPTRAVHCGVVSIRPNDQHMELAFYGRALRACESAAPLSTDMATLAVRSPATVAAANAAAAAAAGQPDADTSTLALPLLTTGVADHVVLHAPRDHCDELRQRASLNLSQAEAAVSAEREHQYALQVQSGPVLLHTLKHLPLHWRIFTTEAKAKAFLQTGLDAKKKSDVKTKTAAEAEKRGLGATLSALRTAVDTEYRKIANYIVPMGQTESQLEATKQSLASDDGLEHRVSPELYETPVKVNANGFAAKVSVYRLPGPTANRGESLQNFDHVNADHAFVSTWQIGGQAKWEALPDELFAVAYVTPLDNQQYDVRLFRDAESLGKTQSGVRELRTLDEIMNDYLATLNTATREKVKAKLIGRDTGQWKNSDEVRRLVEQSITTRPLEPFGTTWSRTYLRPAVTLTLGLTYPVPNPYELDGSHCLQYTFHTEDKNGTPGLRYRCNPRTAIEDAALRQHARPTLQTFPTVVMVSPKAVHRRAAAIPDDEWKGMVDLLAAGAAGVPAEAAADDHLRAHWQLAQAAYDALKASPKSKKSLAALKVLARTKGGKAASSTATDANDADDADDADGAQGQASQVPNEFFAAVSALLAYDRARRLAASPGRSKKAASWPALTLRDVATQYLGRADVQALLDEQAEQVPEYADPAARAALLSPARINLPGGMYVALRADTGGGPGRGGVDTLMPLDERLNMKSIADLVPARGWHEIADSQHQAAWFANEQTERARFRELFTDKTLLEDKPEDVAIREACNELQQMTPGLWTVFMHERLLSYELEQRLLYMLAPDQPEWRQDWSAVTTATLNRVRDATKKCVDLAENTSTDAFRGALQELSDALAALPPVTRLPDGAVESYWRSAGTLQFDGLLTNALRSRMYGSTNGETRQGGHTVLLERLGIGEMRGFTEERALALRHHNLPEVAYGGVGPGRRSARRLLEETGELASALEVWQTAKTEANEAGAMVQAVTSAQEAQDAFSSQTLVTPLYACMIPFNELRDASCTVDAEFNELMSTNRDYWRFADMYRLETTEALVVLVPNKSYRSIDGRAERGLFVTGDAPRTPDEVRDLVRRAGVSDADANDEVDKFSHTEKHPFCVRPAERLRESWHADRRRFGVSEDERTAFVAHVHAWQRAFEAYVSEPTPGVLVRGDEHIDNVLIEQHTAVLRRSSILLTWAMVQRKTYLSAVYDKPELNERRRADVLCMLHTARDLFTSLAWLTERSNALTMAARERACYDTDIDDATLAAAALLEQHNLHASAALLRSGLGGTASTTKELANRLTPLRVLCDVKASRRRPQELEDDTPDTDAQAKPLTLEEVDRLLAETRRPRADEDPDSYPTPTDAWKAIEAQAQRLLADNAKAVEFGPPSQALIERTYPEDNVLRTRTWAARVAQAYLAQTSGPHEVLEALRDSLRDAYFARGFGSDVDMPPAPTSASQRDAAHRALREVLAHPAREELEHDTDAAKLFENVAYWLAALGKDTPHAVYTEGDAGARHVQLIRHNLGVLQAKLSTAGIEYRRTLQELESSNDMLTSLYGAPNLATPSELADHQTWLRAAQQARHRLRAVEREVDHALSEPWILATDDWSQRTADVVEQTVHHSRALAVKGPAGKRRKTSASAAAAAADMDMDMDVDVDLPPLSAQSQGMETEATTRNGTAVAELVAITGADVPESTVVISEAMDVEGLPADGGGAAPSPPASPPAPPPVETLADTVLPIGMALLAGPSRVRPRPTDRLQCDGPFKKNDPKLRKLVCDVQKQAQQTEQARGAAELQAGDALRSDWDALERRGRDVDARMRLLEEACALQSRARRCLHGAVWELYRHLALTVCPERKALLAAVEAPVPRHELLALDARISKAAMFGTRYDHGSVDAGAPARLSGCEVHGYKGEWIQYIGHIMKDSAEGHPSTERPLNIFGYLWLRSAWLGDETGAVPEPTCAPNPWWTAPDSDALLRFNPSVWASLEHVKAAVKEAAALQAA